MENRTADIAGEVPGGRVRHYVFGLQMPGRVYVSGSETREGFTGHELDAETGMYYAGARYYMPALGRWTATDPLASEFPSFSPYNYALNNPVSLMDPDGAAPDCPSCDIRQNQWIYERTGVRLPRASGRQVLTGLDITARTLVEPYDWGRMGIDWAMGNGSGWDAAALLPFVSGPAGRAVGDIVESVKAFRGSLAEAASNIRSDKISHIMEGSTGSDHAWELVLDDANFENVQGVIQDVAENGRVVSEGRHGSVAKRVNGQWVEVRYGHNNRGGTTINDAYVVTDKDRIQMLDELDGGGN